MDTSVVGRGSHATTGSVLTSSQLPMLLVPSLPRLSPMLSCPIAAPVRRMCSEPMKYKGEPQGFGKTQNKGRHLSFRLLAVFQVPEVPTNFVCSLLRRSLSNVFRYL